GRIISVDLDSVRFPNGTVGDLEMVRHPGASAVVPFLDPIDQGDPRIVLIRQYRYAAEGFVFEIPAGRLDQGESPETCARRELKEETGYSANELIRLTTFYTTPGFTDERIHLFAATGLEAGESQTEADEILDLVTLPLSKALEMIARGELVDGKSIVGLMFAASFARNG
ncbi:MAG TPA: NUDIX hydrolase, partial [Gemmatimonadaceae bacterium]